MSNAVQINNSTNNSQQKKPVWFWVVTVLSFQFLFGSITVLANLAQIADSLQGFCKEYDIDMIEGVCNALKEKQRKTETSTTEKPQENTPVVQQPTPKNSGNQSSSSLPKLIFTKSKGSDFNTDSYKKFNSDNMRQTSGSETQISFKRAK